jgi:hypothetical protein
MGQQFVPIGVETFPTTKIRRIVYPRNVPQGLNSGNSSAALPMIGFVYFACETPGSKLSSAKQLLTGIYTLFTPE